jgi:hypothetical protein
VGLLEIGLGGVDWIGLGQHRYSRGAIVNAAMNLRVPKNTEELTCGLSSGDQLHRVLCSC